MQRVFSTYKIWRSVASYVRNDHCARSFSTLSIGKLHQSEFLYDFMKWGSIGFQRMSRFATRFNPLREKPLDSIVDIHRLKDRYPDDIASIWDDVISHLFFLIKLSNIYFLFHPFSLFCFSTTLVEVISEPL